MISRESVFEMSVDVSSHGSQGLTLSESRCLLDCAASSTTTLCHADTPSTDYVPYAETSLVCSPVYSFTTNCSFESHISHVNLSYGDTTEFPSRYFLPGEGGSMRLSSPSPAHTLISIDTTSAIFLSVIYVIDNDYPDAENERPSYSWHVPAASFPRISDG